MVSATGEPGSRREARASEARAAEAAASIPSATVMQPARVAFPRRSIIASRGRAQRGSMRAGRTRYRAGSRVGSSASSKLLSLGALMFAGTLLVGMSVPANAFMNTTDALGYKANIASGLPGQSLRVSADLVEVAPVRDAFDVTSYAEVLALKYAGIDYSYSVTSGSVRWPFPYSVPINDGFGPRSDGFHKGIDLMAASGTPIYAIADGIATTSVYDGSGYGQHVVLQHSLGGVDVRSLYAHMIADSSPIQVGQQVKVGDFLGLVGNTGYSTMAHLHFEVHVSGAPIDPFEWLQANASN